MPSPFLTAPSAAGIAPRRFSAASYGSLYDWTIRLIVASANALAAIGNLSSITQIIDKSKHEPFVYSVLNMAAGGASALFVALAAATILTRLPPVRKSEGITPRITALVGANLVIVMAMLPRPELPLVVLAISFLLVIVGMLTSFAVLRWLGRAFSIMPEARRLVTHGPYRLIRHPLYLCEEIAVIGVFIQVISPLAAVLLILHAGFQFQRMLNEERVLSATFPDYADYARRTPRLIPARWLGKRFEQAKHFI
jgi:protein-S-isoprenylcysteine O-methyltransferase Ste14